MVTKIELDDRIEYRNGKGQLHKEDGPAVEFSNGSKAWYLNGKRHREDGPAIEYYYGYKAWYLNDKHHREDGPAIEYSDGTKKWYLNEKSYTEQEYHQEVIKIKLERLKNYGN